LPWIERGLKHFMRQISKGVLLLVPVVALTAADPSWTNKPIPQWSVEDAKEILASSPWVNRVTVGVIPAKNEAQQREGGKWGGSQGVGFESLSPAVFTGVGGVQQPGKRRAIPGRINPVEVRWESAAPVRAAEKRAQDTDAPAWEGNYYVIAVYDVPGLDINERWLAGELKHAALLKLDGKKALKPERVDCLPQVGGLTTVVYLFPRTTKITLENKRIELDARFGRLSLAQSFFTREMQYQGKLEL
jgi:hypothetical protein